MTTVLLEARLITEEFKLSCDSQQVAAQALNTQQQP